MWPARVARQRGASGGGGSARGKIAQARAGGASCLWPLVAADAKGPGEPPHWPPPQHASTAAASSSQLTMQSVSPSLGASLAAAAR